jgi:hypothetical protein
VSFHNARDWNALASLFADDGELCFEGIPLPPSIGRVAIARAFVDQPPDDAIVIGPITVDGPRAEARYSWRGAPALHEGSLVIEVTGARIRRLLVRRGDSAPGSA